MSLTDISGGALRISLVGTNTGGINVTVDPQTASGSYSFNASTFTLKPTGESAMTFIMAYGTLSTVAPIGAPSSVHLVRQSSSGETADPNNCVQTITATR